MNILCHRVLIAAAVALAATITLAGLSLGASGASAAAWGRAVEIVPPENGTEARGELSDVACSAPGSCVAVGEYSGSSNVDSSGKMGAAEADGVWSQATEIPVPPNNDGVNFPRSVSCPPSGPCVAVGSYYNSLDAGLDQGMAVTESGGVWGQPSTILGVVMLESISCPASGDCVVAGEIYIESSGTFSAMVASESEGTWGEPVEIALPAHANSRPRFRSVSCPAVGSCVAVGEYEDSAGKDQAMAVVESAGKWGNAVEITPPGNAGDGQTTLYSVSCPPSGPCVALGEYEDSSRELELMAVDESEGTWEQGSEITTPENFGSAEWTVSCPASGSCLASTRNHSPFVLTEAPFVLTEAAGVWGTPGEPDLTLPANAKEHSTWSLSGVSCPTLGSCVAVGSYEDSCGGRELMAVSETELASSSSDSSCSSKESTSETGGSQEGPPTIIHGTPIGQSNGESQPPIIHGLQPPSTNNNPSCALAKQPTTPRKPLLPGESTKNPPGSWFDAAARLGDKTSSGYSPLYGISANIRNCHTWVSHSDETGVSAWVMLQEYLGNGGEEYAQVGWIEHDGAKLASDKVKPVILVEVQDSITKLEGLLKGGKIQDDCEGGHGSGDLACHKLPGLSAGTTSQYSVAFIPAKGVWKSPSARPTPQVKQITISGNIATQQVYEKVISEIQAHRQNVLTLSCKYFRSQLHVLLRSPGTATCKASYNYFGTFTYYVNGQIVATSPALFDPDQADVAGEIHRASDQMPGTSGNPEEFTDVRVVDPVRGHSWTAFDGTVSQTPTGDFGQLLAPEAFSIWDKGS